MTHGLETRGARRTQELHGGRSLLVDGFQLVVCWLGVGLLVLVFSFNSFLNGCRSHLRDWRDHAKHFKVPPEARIVSACVCQPFPMGEETTIEFKLPATRIPEEWVKRIADGSGIPDHYRKSAHSYDGPGDYNMLEYDPKTGIYRIMLGWD